MPETDANGNAIVYTVVQDAVPNYETTYSADTLTIINSYIGGVLRTTITLPTGQELLITGANPVSQYPAGCAVQVFWDPDVAAVVERGKPVEKG